MSIEYIAFIGERYVAANDSAQLCFVAHYTMKALPQSTGICMDGLEI